MAGPWEKYTPAADAEADGPWAKYKAPDVSKTESALRGAAQGATLGFGDEATGGIRAVAQKLIDAIYGNDNGDSIGDDYTHYRDEVRDSNAAAQKANPKTYTAAEIAGGAIPTMAAGPELSAAKMASLGGISGLGNSEADLTKGDALGAGADTAVGTAMGYGVGKVAQPLLDAAGNVIGKGANIVKQGAGTLAKKAISGIFGPSEEAVNALVDNPDIRNKSIEGVARKLPDVAGKFEDVISGLNQRARAVLSKSKYLEPAHGASVEPFGSIEIKKSNFSGISGKMVSGTPEDLEKVRVHLSDTSPIKSGQTVPISENTNFSNTAKINNLYGDKVIDLGDSVFIPDALFEKYGLGRTVTDQGGAFAKDEVLGAVKSARRSLGGVYTDESRSAANTLARVEENLNKIHNTVSQNQVHDLIMDLDNEIPWDKAIRSPQDLTATDHAMMDARSNLDDLLKSKNEEYAKIMEPLSDAIEGRNSFAKKFDLKRSRGGTYEPGDQSFGRLRNSLKDGKLETERVLGDTKDLIGVDLGQDITDAAHASEFEGPGADSHKFAALGTGVGGMVGGWGGATVGGFGGAAVDTAVDRSGGKMAGDIITKYLNSDPSKLGRYASILAEAAAKGGTGGADNVMVRHFVLSNSDPKYREMMKRLQEGHENNSGGAADEAFGQ